MEILKIFSKNYFQELSQERKLNSYFQINPCSFNIERFLRLEEKKINARQNSSKWTIILIKTILASEKIILQIYSAK